MRLIYALMERDLLPDSAIRFGIRRLLASRLRQEDRGSSVERANRRDALVAELRQSPIALHTERANEQHYEVPAEFYRWVLGPHRKYSSAFWPAGVETLAAAEEAMLRLSVERAELVDGQDVLELGCGWGSLTLYMAERFPASRIVAVSNSHSQRRYITETAAVRALGNVEVITADMNDFAPDRTFDRVVSIEMFEHMRNYERLLARIASWLIPGGKLFVHIFCHRELAYPFEVRDASDWMAKYFFTGGLMPSADLLLHFTGPVELEERWLVNGIHYEKTALAWLANMDTHRDEILPVLTSVYGRSEERRWWVYWRVFFLACAELFGYRGGEEWLVAHSRFVRP